MSPRTCLITTVLSKAKTQKSINISYRGKEIYWMSKEQQSMRSENSPQDTHYLVGKTINDVKKKKSKIVDGNGTKMWK